MLLGLALVVSVSTGELRLAAMPFTQVGLSDEQAAFYAEHFALKLQQGHEADFKVTSPKDVATLLGIERQRQLMGCTDESTNCMAELAGALGADGLISGQVAKVGNSFQISVKILRGNGSGAMFLHSSELLPNEEALLIELNGVAAKAAQELRPARATTENIVEQPSAPKAAKRWPKLLPAVGGLAGLVLGGVGFGFANDKYRTLSDPARWQNNTADWALSLRNEGKNAITAASIATGLGAALLIGGIVWFLLS